jgi:phage shock protein PspC (stress-responsive transcriptional regulator)
MKKTISISIAGMLFHVEEDAYLMLQEYLESINRYFSTMADAREILADIEARMAELLMRRPAEVGPAVRILDVENMIATLGTVEEFMAAEGATAEQSYTAVPPMDDTKEKSTEANETRRWLKDRTTKRIDGVLGGLANYLMLDAIWVRVFAVVALVLLTSAFQFPGFASCVLAYVALSLLLPVDKRNLAYVHRKRKLFREQEGQVIGGVAGGLAQYLSLDVVIVRLILIGLIFLGGSGLLIYIALWLAAPIAKSTTDRMQMAGQKITLESIRERVETSRAGSEAGQIDSNRSQAYKLLMLPFELLGGLLRGLGPIFKFLFRGVGIFIGFILFVIALSLTLVSLAAITGLVQGDINATNWIQYEGFDFNLKAFLNDIPAAVMWLGVGVVSLTALDFLLHGVSLMAGKRLMAPSVRWGITGLLVLTIVLFLWQLQPVVAQYAQESEREQRVAVKKAIGSYTISAREVGAGTFLRPNVRFVLSENDSIYVVSSLSSRGATESDAERAAQMILPFSLRVDTASVEMDNGLKLADGSKFRFQRLDLRIEMPDAASFDITPAVARLTEGLKPGRYIMSRFDGPVTPKRFSEMIQRGENSENIDSANMDINVTINGEKKEKLRIRSQRNDSTLTIDVNEQRVRIISKGNDVDVETE